MSEFLQYVIWQLQNSLAFVLLAFIAFTAVLGVTYLLHRKKYKGERKYPWGRTFLWLVFLGYLVVVLYATLFRSSLGQRAYNLHLFRAWREAWNNFSQHRWLNILLNIAMFGPLGFLLPLLNKRYHKWYRTFPAGFCVSLSLELLQLIFACGVFDVDDLFCNTLGAVMGYFGIMLILSLFNEKGKRIRPFMTYLCLILVPVMAIGSIFVAYQTWEYGNFPNAAAYHVDLSHMEWKVTCNLPDTAENVPVYSTQTMSKQDCDVFADQMASMVGQKVDLASYYQEMAYYNLTQGILLVNYHDGSYEFGGYDHNITQWEEAARGTLENALRIYSIVIPEAAEFTYEGDGWYRFTCDRFSDGTSMMDGTLRVRYGVDNTVRRIENYLVKYTHYKDVPVITPKEAFGKVKSGEFAYAEALKNHASGSVSVVSCTMDYEIDTKGFYRPVYIFEILIPETGNTCQAIISAMK